MIWDKPWFQFSILLLLGFIWGSSFILMKIGLISFSYEQVASIRILLASLVLFPSAIKYIKQLKRKDLKSILVAGFIGSFIPAFLFTKAQTNVDSAMAGMLNSLTPVFTLLVGLILYRKKTDISQVLGLGLGLIGALGLINGSLDFNFANMNYYSFYIILATICYAFNIYEIKMHLPHLTGIQITSFSFLFIGPFALIYLLTTDFTPIFQNSNWLWHFSAIATLGIVGSAGALLLMNTLLLKISPIYASSVTYIIPIFAIIWGFIDGENITIGHLIFMGIIFLSVYLIKYSGSSIWKKIINTVHKY